MIAGHKEVDIDGSGTIEFSEFLQMQLKAEKRKSQRNLLAAAAASRWRRGSLASLSARGGSARSSSRKQFVERK